MPPAASGPPSHHRAAPERAVPDSGEGVSGQREAEAAPRRSERQFREVAETVPGILFRTAADGRVDFVSGHFERLTGFAPNAILGSLMWPELVHADDRDRVQAVWAEARAHETPYETRYRLLTPDGPRWVITRAHPVRDGRAVAAWFGTVTDVDDLVRAEAEVRRLNATLEEQVAERTGQVRRLMARLAVAEQDERARIARVLHDDLQQQLVGLSITLGLARSATDEGERQPLRDQADEILESAITLTRSLATEVAPPALASTDLTETLLWLAAGGLAHHRLTIAVEAAEPCPVPARGVRTLLYHATRELLLNVVKHAGADRATVRAWRSGPGVVVEVEDAGRGFDPAEVFAEPGGLGLVSVRERVELAGGRFDLDAEPGRGVRVRIDVPAGEPPGRNPQGAIGENATVV